jgi:hypothetical protein
MSPCGGPAVAFCTPACNVMVVPLPTLCVGERRTEIVDSAPGSDVLALARARDQPAIPRASPGCITSGYPPEKPLLPAHSTVTFGGCWGCPALETERMAVRVLVESLPLPRALLMVSTRDDTPSHCAAWPKSGDEKEAEPFSIEGEFESSTVELLDEAPLAEEPLTEEDEELSTISGSDPAGDEMPVNPEIVMYTGRASGGMVPFMEKIIERVFSA